MVISCIKMVGKPERRLEMIRTIQGILGPVRVMPGCIQFYSFQDLENENAFLIFEQWETEEDAIRFIRSREFQKITALSLQLTEPPSFSYYTISITRGLELIDEVLGAAETET